MRVPEGVVKVDESFRPDGTVSTRGDTADHR